MADIKITALPALAATADILDVLAIVDVSDNGITASGTTKSVLISELPYLANGSNISLLNNDTGFITVSDFSNNGEAATANRDLGNTDAFGLSFITNGVGRINILAGGDVGIGTSTPARLFEVDGLSRFGDTVEVFTGNNFGVHCENTGNAAKAHLQFRGTGEGQLALYDTAGGLDVLFNGATFQNYMLSGNFGIGTATPTEKLDVAGNTIIGAVAQGNPLIVKDYLGNDMINILRNSSSKRIGIGDVVTNMKTTVFGSTGDVFEVSINGTNPYCTIGGDPNADGYLKLFRTGVAEGARISLATDSLTDTYFDIIANFGIGTSTPSQKLEVAGNGKFAGQVITERVVAIPVSPDPEYFTGYSYGAVTKRTSFNEDGTHNFRAGSTVSINHSSSHATTALWIAGITGGNSLYVGATSGAGNYLVVDNDLGHIGIGSAINVNNRVTVVGSGLINGISVHNSAMTTNDSRAIYGLADSTSAIEVYGGDFSAQGINAAGSRTGIRSSAVDTGTLHNVGIKAFARRGTGQNIGIQGTVQIGSVGTDIKAVFGECLYSGVSDAHGGYFSATGAGTTNIGLYATATGATTNYALNTDGNINMANIPTSSAGLSAGDIWNNSGVLSIV